MRQQRRLAAILFTDIVGYTALMQQDEIQAVNLIKKYQSILLNTTKVHGGEILNDYGDGSLCTFPSAMDAVLAAMELQKSLNENPPVPLRIGLHIGEIFFEGGKVLGDGVNIASRIQSLGQANTILFSGEINNKIRNHPDFNSISLGIFEFKNVEEPIEVFALSNQGFIVPKKEAMRGKLKDKPKKSQIKKLIPVAVILLLVAAGVLFYTKFQHKTKFTGTDKSIAVLPFVNMSTDKENEYFSDGMTEEITTQLSKITSLKVIARTSAMLYKNSNKSIKEIANELKVSSILEGSVQKDGDKVKITAQLIDAATQEHIWADNWDREFKEIFDIQNEVAQQIAYQLNVKLSIEEANKIEKIPTNSTEAYQYYLRGNQLLMTYWETLQPELFENCKTMLENAISLDPKYAKAHAALADLYNTYTNFVNKDSSGIRKQVKEIEKAWEIDSTDDYVVNVRGVIEYTALGNIDQGFLFLKKALELNPNNVFTLANLAGLLGDYFGLYDESKILLDRAVLLDPLSAGFLSMRGYYNFVLNRSNEAKNDIETALRLQPKLISALDQLAAIYAELGLYENSKKMIERSLKEKPDLQDHNFFNLAYAYAKLSNAQKAMELAPKTFAILLALGKIKEALKVLPPDTIPFTAYIIYKSYLNTKSFEPIKNDPVFLHAMDQYKKIYDENKRKYSVAYLLH